MTYDDLSTTLAELQEKVPTNDQLRSYIDKIAAFLKTFFELFDQLKAGLTQTFYGYQSIYPWEG